MFVNMMNAGPMFFLLIQAASIQTCYNIYLMKNVGSLSIIPYVSLFTNCSVWVMYTLITEDYTVMWPNLAGVFTGLGCTCIYHIYSFDNHLKVYFVSFVLIGLSLKFATTLDTTSIGIEGCVLATVLMGSPLATIGTVLKERSTAALPLYPSLFTWCNAASWSLYGILISKDVMIWSPNVAGLILATVQMFMFVLFGLPPTNRKKTGSTFPGV